MSNETAVVTQCMKVLERYGIYAQRMNTGAARYNERCPYCKRRPRPGGTRFVKYGQEGNPDIWCRIPRFANGFAVPLYWECKKDDEVGLRKKQSEFIDDAIKDGCIAGYGTAIVLEKLLISLDLEPVV